MGPGRDPQLKAPVPPEGFDWRDTWYDLSPMRPDAFGTQQAARWRRAEQIQLAFRKGRRLGAAQITAAEERKQQCESAIEKLKKKLGG